MHLVPGDNLALPDSVSNYAPTMADLSTVDGFGTTGDITLYFSGPLDITSLPQGDGSGRADAALVLVDLDAPGPRFVDFELTAVREKAGDPRTTLVIRPTRPLLPTRRYGVALTTGARDFEGRCIAPATTTRAILRGTASDPRLARLHGPVAELVARLQAAGTIDGIADLSAAVVFTTQSTYDTSLAVAELVRGKSYTFQRTGPCADTGVYLDCPGAFVADDFRADGRAIDDDAPPTVAATYLLPVTTFLPPTGSPPYPTVIFAHGLGSGRRQGRDLAEVAAPLGLAVVAVDAVKHADHPDGPTLPGALGALEFFGLNTSMDPPLDALRLRDNFRQSTYDKLQLVEALRPGVDVTGDGTPDVDVERLGFVGASLGGLMSSEFLAFAPDVRWAIVTVPGAEVGGIIQHGDMFGTIVTMFRGSASDGQVARFFAMLQTALDRGDPAAYGRHVMLERLPGVDGQTPQVLIQMVIGDEIVPNISNLAYAQALGLPHLGDELLPIPGIPREAPLPAAGNVAPGQSGGIFQFDVVWVGGGPQTETATHDNVSINPVALEQSLHFAQTVLAGGAGELVDPYRTLGIKP